MRAGVVRPGQSLLEHLEVARLLAYPATNLTEAVAEKALSDELRGFYELPTESFRPTPVASLPDVMREHLEAHPDVHLWFTSTDANMLADAGLAPEPVFADGTPLPVVEDLTPELEGRGAFWYELRSTVACLGTEPPEGVRLVSPLDLTEEFGFVERGRVVAGEPPTLERLRGRFELGNPASGATTRDGLLLAAPAAVEWHVARWEADALEFSVGMFDRSWHVSDGAVQRVASQSDGARFVLEVDGEERWSRVMTPGEVGTTAVDVRVDLAAARGGPLHLRFRTEPGPDGRSVADYAVVAGLRARGRPVRPPQRPHVVFIDIDTLRADRLAAYGGKGRTPGIDAWAAEHATVYTDSLSTASWTLPATLTLLTGLAAHQHGVGLEGEALHPATETLASRLRAAGYETRAVTTGAFLRPIFGCATGFDSYETRMARHLDWLDEVEALERGDSERPVFLFLQSYAVHHPYPYDDRFVDPDYDGPLAGVDVNRSTCMLPYEQGRLELDEADMAYCEALYDALVADMDARVGEVLERLQPLAREGRVLVVFTSDHGEAFLEHGIVGHGKELYGELLDVPLVVQYPDGARGVDDRPVSSVDIAPTILEVVGLPPDPSLPGRPLRATDDDPRVRVAQLDERRLAVHSETWKLLEKRDGAVLAADPAGVESVYELYDLGSDPGERADVAAERRDLVDELRRRHTWFVESFPPEEQGAVSSRPGAAELEQLRALGYLGDG